jgi:spore maturation protein CgeB
MNFVLFYHSLVSDWNHGNAHFLRGVVTELMDRGHRVQVFEPVRGWSLRNLRESHGDRPLDAFQAAYPGLRSSFYDPATLDLDEALDGADVVIVHEWNEPELVARIGAHCASTRHCRLLFHDTHHRAVSAPHELRAYDLSNYDGVLAFGEVLSRLYRTHGWTDRVWTWHEAADTRVFRPLPGVPKSLDLVWVGNWGDGERTAEILEFLIEPVRALNLNARIYGVRYPQEALRTLHEARIDYGGWIANFKVPEVFAGALATVHVPRRFYREQLQGIPTIRVFEALACGIPLVSAPWEDTEGLFQPGRDFLMARSGEEMRQCLRRLRWDPAFAQELALHGHRTILNRHTCGHRVEELLGICRELGVRPSVSSPSVSSKPAPAPLAVAAVAG